MEAFSLSEIEFILAERPRCSHFCYFAVFFGVSGPIMDGAQMPGGGIDSKRGERNRE